MCEDNENNNETLRVLRKAAVARVSQEREYRHSKEFMKAVKDLFIKLRDECLALDLPPSPFAEQLKKSATLDALTWVIGSMVNAETTNQGRGRLLDEFHLNLLGHALTDQSSKKYEYEEWQKVHSEDRPWEKK